MEYVGKLAFLEGAGQEVVAQAQLSGLAGRSSFPREVSKR